MVPDNTLTDFRNQSESHDGPELNLYTAGANTGAWAFVVTKTDTNTDTDTHPDPLERRRDELSEELQSPFLPQIHSVARGLSYVDDSYPDAVVSTLTHQEAIVGLVEGTNDPSEQYRDRYREANQIYIDHQPAWDITYIPTDTENPARELL
ncbi:MAG: hypothetical protein J07HQX50_01772 [Haloquadratum sp. J07HQX50]|nr:MAG: hypothetical protein J07HQX50_01772 [Haloquadratum sp. J07HQX50]